MSKVRFALIALALVVVSSSITALVTARVTEGAAQGQEQQDMAEIMKKWAEYATPGAVHKALSKQLGTWSMSMTFRDPQGQERKEDGTAEYTSLLDGRFIMMKQKCSYMGRPFNCVQILGYDNLQKKYCSLWLDSFATGMFVSYGQADEKGCVELKGLMKDAMTPKGRMFRTVMVPMSDNEFRVDLFDTQNGKEFKMGVVNYKRKP